MTVKEILTRIFRLKNKLHNPVTNKEFWVDSARTYGLVSIPLIRDLLETQQSAT